MGSPLYHYHKGNIFIFFAPREGKGPKKDRHRRKNYSRINIPSTRGGSSRISSSLWSYFNWVTGSLETSHHLYKLIHEFTWLCCRPWDSKIEVIRRSDKGDNFENACFLINFVYTAEKYGNKWRRTTQVIIKSMAIKHNKLKNKRKEMKKKKRKKKSILPVDCVHTNSQGSVLWISKVGTFCGSDILCSIFFQLSISPPYRSQPLGRQSFFQSSSTPFSAKVKEEDLLEE